MKVLIDMNLSPTWVDFFKENNIDSIHWSSVGKAYENDHIIFDYASKNNYLIFTNDLDFGAILAATNAKSPSVFQLKSQELMPNFIGDLVIYSLRKFQKELFEGVLITFDVSKVRIRILPIN